MIYPCAVVYHKGSNVDFYPFLVEAANEDEALGKATRIGYKLRPEGNDVYAKVGKPNSITPEEARLVK